MNKNGKILKASSIQRIIYDKVIFLDIDGVLNAPDFFIKIEKDEGFEVQDLCVFNACSPIAMSWLRWIIRETKAHIVLSSTWRLCIDNPKSKERKILDGYFTAYNIPFDYDKTINMRGLTRGKEIRHWLETHNFKGKYVILDDDSDMDNLPNFIHIDGNIGLTKENAKQAVEILNKEN